MAQATPDAEQFVTAHVAVWNDRDYVKIPGLVSEPFVWYDTNASADDIPGPESEFELTDEATRQ